MQKHSLEAEVKHMVSLDKKDSFFFFKKLRNLSVLEELSPKPTEGVTCLSCNIILKSKNSLRHLKHCPLAIQDEVTKADCIRAQYENSHSKALSLVLSRMKNDEIGEDLKNDELIINYAEYLVASQLNVNDVAWQNKIKQYLRLLGRCVHAAKKIKNAPVQLRDLLKPDLESFEFLIDCAFKAVGTTASEADDKETATIPGRIGDQLKNVINYLEFLACASVDDEESRVRKLK